MATELTTWINDMGHYLLEDGTGYEVQISQSESGVEESWDGFYYIAAWSDPYEVVEGFKDLASAKKWGEEKLFGEEPK